MATMVNYLKLAKQLGLKSAAERLVYDMKLVICNKFCFSIY